MMGGRRQPGGGDVMATMGIDLSDHESQPLTEQLVRHADLILDHDPFASAGDHGRVARRGRPRDAAVPRSARTWPTRSAARRKCTSAAPCRSRPSWRDDWIARTSSFEQSIRRTAAAGSERVEIMQIAIGSDHRGFAVKEQHHRAAQAAGPRGGRRRHARATASTIPTSPPSSAAR